MSSSRVPGGRLAYERAIRRSDLPPPSRHIALTIATWADIDTGIIPDRFQPSLGTLEEATGLARKTVRTHLDRLEAGGWIVRDRPDLKKARMEHARTHYTLGLPSEARGSDPLALGEEIPQPRGSDPPGWGQSAPRARGGDPLKSPSQSHESHLSPPPSPEPPVAAASVTGERETMAAPNNNSNSGEAVRVVDAYTAALGRPTTARTREQLHTQAQALLADGLPVAWLEARATELAEHGWTDLAKHAERSTVPVPGAKPTRPAASGMPPWCGDPDCSEVDRMRDREIDTGHFVVVRCPDCHPHARKEAA